MIGGLADQLDRLLVKYKDLGVLLDTNVLLLLLIAKFDSTLIGGKRLEKYDTEAANLLIDFAAQFGRLLTTTTVLTETSNLLGQVLKGQRRRDLFELISPAFTSPAGEFFPRLGIEAIDVDKDVFVQLGYTDATLVSVLAASSGLLLTDDLDLFLQAQRHGIDVVNFTHMREAAGLL